MTPYTELTPGVADMAEAILDRLAEFHEAKTDLERMDAAFHVRLYANSLIADLATTCAYEDYLKTHWWARLSNRAKEKAGFTCTLCRAEGKRIGGAAVLHAHHADYALKGCDAELEDLVVLCSDCHARHHGKA